MFGRELETQDKGNEYVKMGKKHYTEALDCYTRAIDQKIADPQHNSVCHANRAHVHLLLGNNRRGYEDAKEAIRLNDKNVKVYLCAPHLLHKCFFCCSSLSRFTSPNASVQKLTSLEINYLGTKVESYDWIQSGFSAVVLKYWEPAIQLLSHTFWKRA